MIPKQPLFDKWKYFYSVLNITPSGQQIELDQKYDLGKIAKAIASADPKRYKPDKNMYRHFLNTLLREEPRKIYTK